MKRFVVPLVTIVLLFVVLPLMPWPNIDLGSSGTWVVIFIVLLLLAYFFAVVPWLSRRPLRNLASSLAGKNPRSLVAVVAIEADVSGMNQKAVILADRRGVMLVRLEARASGWAEWESIQEIRVMRSGAISQVLVEIVLDQSSIVIAPVRKGPFSPVPEWEIETFANRLRLARNIDPDSTEPAEADK